MLEHVPGDGAAFGHGPYGKSGFEIPHRQPPMAAVHGVEREPEQRSGGQHGTHRQDADDGHHRRDCGVLETMAE